MNKIKINGICFADVKKNQGVKGLSLYNSVNYTIPF